MSIANILSRLSTLSRALVENLHNYLNERFLEKQTKSFKLTQNLFFSWTFTKKFHKILKKFPSKNLDNSPSNQNRQDWKQSQIFFSPISRVQTSFQLIYPKNWQSLSLNPVNNLKQAQWIFHSFPPLTTLSLPSPSSSGSRSPALSKCI